MKFPTFPTLYDNCKTVSISFLNKHGYLKPNQYQRGTVIWSVNGNKIDSISIAVNTKPESSYLELNYKAMSDEKESCHGMLSEPLYA